MRKKPKPGPRPSSNKGGLETDSSIASSGSAARQQFLVLAATMSWQLAVVVLVPIIAGVELDKHTNSASTYLFVGLAVAVVGSVLIMWRTMQAANALPVPKLSAAQKRAIKKSYEDEDED